MQISLLSTMKLVLIVLLSLRGTAKCGTVPVDPFEEMTSTETFKKSNDMTTESDSTDQSTFSTVVPTTTQSTAFFGMFRNFLSDARRNIFEALPLQDEDFEENKADKMMRIIEHKLIEATTTFMNQVENAALTTVPPSSAEQHTDLSKLKLNQTEARKTNSADTAKQGVSDFVATPFCNNCFDKLRTCVKQCFTESSCIDVDRKDRSCSDPGICNPFTPWSSVDECSNDQDCATPFICCVDGCTKKCVPGVLRV